MERIGAGDLAVPRQKSSKHFPPATSVLTMLEQLRLTSVGGITPLSGGCRLAKASSRQSCSAIGYRNGRLGWNFCQLKKRDSCGSPATLRDSHEAMPGR